MAQKLAKAKKEKISGLRKDMQDSLAKFSKGLKEQDFDHAMKVKD